MKARFVKSREALKEWAWWLGLSLVTLFFSALLVGWGGYGGALLAVMLLVSTVGVFWLFFVFMAVAKCWQLIFGPDADVRTAIFLLLSPFVAAALFAGLAFPVMWLSGWVQPLSILAFNKIAYDHAVAEQSLKPLPVRDAILVWPWGGSLDSDLDIVWDPMDSPKQRLQQKEGGGNANCRHLISHYYDCGIWF